MTAMQTPPATRQAVPVELPMPRRAALPESLSALSGTGAGPLHLQLRAVLDGAVDSAGLDHGTRIWSESQLMRHYGVSRHVVRQALNQLVLEGRLSVRKGAGYFVNRRRVLKHLPVVSSLSADLAATGEPFSVDLLDVGPAPALDEEEAALAARPSQPRVHRVRGIGRLDGEPVAMLTGAYPTSLARVLNRRTVLGRGVHQALADHGKRPHHADVVLAVTFATAEESGLLEVPEGTSFVCIRSRMRTEAGELVEVTRELYRTDRFEFTYGSQVALEG
ncbi:MAG TPA: GntR family transcriptional regulator [Mycobacteriales bacterium]|nr:GntR family transcriptional regulator [Mycobacteriales bacterium]